MNMILLSLAACNGGKDQGTTPGVDPFRIDVDVRVWTPNLKGEVCVGTPTADYVPQTVFGYGELKAVEQEQSWPVYIAWDSDVPVTIPALGIFTPTKSDAVWFNPWHALEVSFCNGEDCVTGIDIDIRATGSLFCVSQTIDGMYEESPSWTESMGEAYGVSNMDSAYSSHYSCTDWAPDWACPATDEPGEDCDDYGCECNLDSWTPVSTTEVQYRAAVTAASGVSSPFFADRWETGGLHADTDGSITWYMYTEVKLSQEQMIFRPVIDMRSDWNGSWSTIPDPDGWEGPPIFQNDANRFIAPSDGYWPVMWHVTPPAGDLWMQPVWNVIVRPGAENGTANLRDLSFAACGEGVSEIVCSESGCEY